MKIWHKALILAVVTESVTIASYVIARGSQGTLFSLALIVHTPALFLTFGLGVPILLTLPIEAALWMLFWFLVLRLFAGPNDELTKLSSGDLQGEWHEPKVKKIVPR
jgi:hypothetical protein